MFSRSASRIDFRFRLKFWRAGLRNFSFYGGRPWIWVWWQFKSFIRRNFRRWVLPPVAWVVVRPDAWGICIFGCFILWGKYVGF